MSSLIPAPDVSLVDGRPMVSSRDVALRFQKKHKEVLRDIERITSMCPKSFTGRNFALSEYTDPTGRPLPCYNLTRDAFTLLAMGFTGKAAVLWKLQYIEAFNALEALALDRARATAELTGARMAYSLSPVQKRRLGRAVRYRKMGIGIGGIARLLGVHAREASFLLKTAALLGRLPQKEAPHAALSR